MKELTKYRYEGLVKSEESGHYVIEGNEYAIVNGELKEAKIDYRYMILEHGDIIHCTVANDTVAYMYTTYLQGGFTKHNITEISSHGTATLIPIKHQYNHGSPLTLEYAKQIIAECNEYQTTILSVTSIFKDN